MDNPVKSAGANDAEFVSNYFKRSLTLLDRVTRDTHLQQTICDIAAVIKRTLSAGGKLMIAGNGGSAADAQHIAAELLSRFGFDRHPLSALALTTDTSVLTAVSNDYSFEHVFERQVRGLGRQGDALLAISTSGTSPNVLAALRAARELGITTIGFTGARLTPMTTLCDVCLLFPSEETALVQQVYLVAAHAICGLVETSMFSKTS